MGPSLKPRGSEEATAAVAFAILAVIALLYIGPAPNAPPAEITEAEVAQIEVEVMTWSDEWIEGARNQDANAVASLLDPDKAQYVINATLHSGWEECVSALEGLYSGWETWRGEWSGRSVEVLGPDVAALMGQTRGPLTLVNGTEGINQVRLSFLLRKRADGWKAVYGHGSGVFTPDPVEEG